MSHVTRIGPAPVSRLARPERIRMRDGIRLAADVYLPGAPDEPDTSPGDTVLIRLPYDKSGAYTFIPLIAEYFTSHGYRVVAQDVRGKFRSEGEPLLFVNEAADGYDTIEWTVNQAWSNGRVAMWGDSYYGYTQWAAVASQHPALCAISPRVTGSQLGEPVRVADDQHVRAVEWAITYLYPLTHFLADDTFEWEMDPNVRPFAAQAERVMSELGRRSPSYDQWYPRTVHLPRFPTGSPFDARPVPTLHTIGWWDNCAPLSWADVAEIEKRPAWALQHFLRIESMDHESYYLDELDEDLVEERSEEQLRAQLPRMLDPTLAFFDVFVRGKGSYADIPRVTWNLAGADGMRTSDSWPPAGAAECSLFARADGTLHAEPSEAVSSLEWIHDPDDLVPSTAPNAFAFLLHRPDEAALSERDDVLVFDTEPFVRDVDFTGPVAAVATVASDGPVMDVFVRLLDVDVDGRALRIARGQIQLDAPEPAATVQVDLGHIGYRVRAGHRLRVHVCSSDFPEFLPQPGTGEEPWGATAVRINRQSLDVGGETAFRLTLTVAPEGTDS